MAITGSKTHKKAFVIPSADEPANLFDFHKGNATIINQSTL